MELVFTILGLVLNMAGAICLACITPFLRYDKKLGCILTSLKENQEKLSYFDFFGTSFQILGIVVLSHVK